jgi:hypothetical protein
MTSSSAPHFSISVAQLGNFIERDCSVAYFPIIADISIIRHRTNVRNIKMQFFMAIIILPVDALFP